MINPEAVQRLNDEIVTLRANMDAVTSRALSRIREAHLKAQEEVREARLKAQEEVREARAKALEEAAQQCEAQRVGFNALDPFDIARNQMCKAFALAIRALKRRDVTMLDERMNVEPAAQGRPNVVQRPYSGNQTLRPAAKNHQSGPSMTC